MKLFKIKKWQFEIKFCPVFLKSHGWLWKRGLRLKLFDVYVTDLSGYCSICNIVISWDKYFV